MESNRKSCLLFLDVKRYNKMYGLIIYYFISGRIIQDVQKLVNENPRCWLHTTAVWRSLYDQSAKQLNLCQEYPDSKKQKLEEENHIENEKQKIQIILETDTIKSPIEDQQKCDIHDVCKDNLLPQGRLFLENTPELIQDKPIVCNSYFSFRVSCRCSGILAKLFTAQVCKILFI